MQVLITIDTEINPVEIEPPARLAINIGHRMWGRAHGKEVGIAYLARTLKEAHLTGVFFVEGLCGSVIDRALLRDWIAVLQDNDQEVQLHVHAEWAQHLGISPPAGLNGFHLAHFRHDDQRRLIGMALENLVAAGAKDVCAFRAGNYAANDDTLSVLTELGIRFDTSYNQLYLGNGCAMTAVDNHNLPFHRAGCEVVPVTNFTDGLGRVRHAQLCACSTLEMRQAMGNALRSNLPAFVIVSHSFELLNMDKERASRINIGRWRSLLRFLSQNRETIRVVGFHDLHDQILAPDRAVGRLSVSKLATFGRLASQAVDHVF